jgi:hypothetical protein
MRVAVFGSMVLVAGCGGSASRFPSSAAGDCGLRAAGAEIVAGTCIPGAHVRAFALRVDAANEPVLVGTFHGRLEIDRTKPLMTKAFAQSFFARFDSGLRPKVVRAIDAPGSLGGAVLDEGGVAVITSSGEGSAGPFFTRLGANGSVVLRRDLGFGGVAFGMSTVAPASIVLRAHREGLRVVRADRNGSVTNAARVAPAWIPQSSPSIAQGSLVGEMASIEGGVVVAHARAPGDDAATSDQALSKVGPDGTIVWTKPATIGSNAQLAAAGGAVAILSPDASAFCAGPVWFAVTLVDREGNARWSKCFPGQTHALRLEADAKGRIVVAGQAKGRIALGAAAYDAGDGVASFVVRLSDDGRVQSSAWLSGLRTVANQALALAPDGTVLLAGAAGLEGVQTHVYVVRLKLG